MRARKYEVAPGRRHAVPDHPHQQQRVDVAAREHRRRPGVAKRVGVVEHRGHGRRPGRLDDQLGPLEQHQQRPGQRLLGDRDDLVDVALDGRERHVARAADRDAVGHRRHRRRAATGWPAASEAGYAAAPSACTPTTRTSGRCALTAVAMPARRPPPPRRHDDRLRRPGTARGSPGRRCPGRRRCRGGRRGGSAPPRSRRRTPGRRPAPRRWCARGSARRRRTRGSPSPWGSARPRA